MSMTKMKRMEQNKYAQCILLCFLLIFHCHTAPRLLFAVAFMFTPISCIACTARHFFSATISKKKKYRCKREWKWHPTSITGSTSKFTELSQRKFILKNLRLVLEQNRALGLTVRSASPESKKVCQRPSGKRHWNSHKGPIRTAMDV